MVGSPGGEIDLLKQGDIHIELFDHGGDGVQGRFEMRAGLGLIPCIPLGSESIAIADIPSQNFEAHAITLIMKIICVDCKYVEPEFAGAWLLVHEGRGLFIECNTNHAIPLLREAAEREGIAPADIDGLVVTHIHLDHAGGAGEFLRVFPNARLYAHPKAARHAIDPSRLVASATGVYGEAFMKKLYGEIRPCEEDRVQVLNDGDSLFFQGVELEIKHTRGHANHHLVVFEPTTRTLFTGDSAGVTYPALNRRHGLVVIPSTSPTDFDGAAALATLDWMEKLAPNRLAPTHFGFIEKQDLPRAFQMLRSGLELSISVQASRDAAGKEAAVKRIEEALRAGFAAIFLRDWGVRLEERDWGILRVDLQVNAQGLLTAP
ncbi:MBL fold metallo-hydrolase [bacterium]|nr:MBL fold metallo-hydrolase [bacterium]